jgi:hypothetical protein
MHSRFVLWAPLLALSLLPPSNAGRAQLANIAVAGCAQLDRGGVCEVGATRVLAIWHEGELPLSVYTERSWSTLSGERGGGGRVFRVPIAERQADLRMRFGQATQVLQLRAASTWPWQTQIETADNVSARELLTGLLPRVAGDERAFVLYELARREYRTGQRGNGAEHLREAAALAAQLGRIALARSSYGLLANHASAAHDFAASRVAIAAARALPAPAAGVRDAYGEALLGNAQGVLAAELGALHEAAGAYENAKIWVERGAAEMRGHVWNGLAMVSVLQGRLLHAHALYESLLESEQAHADACFRAIALGNVGWVELELLRTGVVEAVGGGLGVARADAASGEPGLVRTDAAGGAAGSAHGADAVGGEFARASVDAASDVHWLVRTDAVSGPPGLVRADAAGGAAGIAHGADAVAGALAVARADAVGGGLGDARAVSEAATRHLRESVEHYARCRATASWRPAHAQLSVAYDALRRGDLSAARAGIEAAGAFSDEPRMAQYRALLVAELALAEGHHTRAAQLFAELYETLPDGLSPEASWRALEGLGRALAAQRRWPEAIARLEAAEQLLARAARGVPDRGALTSFFGTHDHSARGLREAYIAVGRSDLAFHALRRAQRRHLLALARDQRVREHATHSAWQDAYANVLQQRGELTQLLTRLSLAPDTERSDLERDANERRDALQTAQNQLLDLLGRDARDQDERLRDPRDGELMLAWLHTSAGLEAYAAFGGHTRHHRYAELPAADGYLEPFADWLAQAREVSVLGFSQPESLDVHALLFRGAPLIDHVPVVYSLDLPPRAAALGESAGQVAVLGYDRRSNLAYAHRELAALTGALRQQGWQAHELAGSDLLQRAGPRPALFYYAGHGTVDTSRNLRSTLALADGELSVAEILTLRSPPARVVLSACDAARVPDLREGMGVSLAQAFVLAGSDEVLAPIRAVGDRAAERVAAAVREGLAGQQPMAAVYRQVLRGAQGEAYAFRVVVR